MATLGRGGHVEEGAASRSHGLQQIDVVSNDVRRQFRIVDISSVLLAVIHQPVEKVDQRGALGLFGLVYVEHQPAIAADGGTRLAWGVDDRELRRIDSQELPGGPPRPPGGGGAKE